MIRDQFLLDIHSELIVDNFAGGGGASTGIELALGRHVDIAINHDPEAVAMHSINHPQTEHFCESVWDVNPREVAKGRPVGLAWFSPDCKHFSKAKGGKPRDKRIRGLAWVVMRWASLPVEHGKPRVIIIENVEEFKTWGPLLEDGHPCPKNKGRTFNSFINALQRHGYQVEHKELRACDYGAPTIRKRLFLIARCDGRPIVWPEPTHAAPDSEAVKSKRLKPWRTAAECIDWSIPCPSIFERAKPLAEATLKRIARGIKRYVIDAEKPFIVNTRNGEREGQAPRTRSITEPYWTITGQGSQGALVAPILTEHANASSQRNFSTEEPLRTQCAEVKGGHYGLACASLIKHYGGNYTGPGVGLDEPASTITTVDHHGLLSASITKFRTGSIGSDMEEPLHTITAGPKENPAGNAHAMGIVTAHLQRDFGQSIGSDINAPAPTVTAGGNGHMAEVRTFLIKYYGEGGQDQDCRDPMHTIPTKDRIGLVTIKGETYAIADIGLRMLAPRELYRAQGFPESYVINPIINGKPLPKHAQVRMVGNSVCPPLSAALAKANVPEMAAWAKHDRKVKVAA